MSPYFAKYMKHKPHKTQMAYAQPIETNVQSLLSNPILSWHRLRPISNTPLQPPHLVHPQQRRRQAETNGKPAPEDRSDTSTEIYKPLQELFSGVGPEKEPRIKATAQAQAAVQKQARRNWRICSGRGVDIGALQLRQSRGQMQRQPAVIQKSWIRMGGMGLMGRAAGDAGIADGGP